jgi:hypothetical protein
MLLIAGHPMRRENNRTSVRINIGDWIVVSVLPLVQVVSYFE